VSAGRCRNATEITSEHRGQMTTCPCSPEMDGACACTPERTIGSDRNLCGCWPEPVARPTPRRACRCGARLTTREIARGYQCPACTARDEALLGVGGI